MTYRTNIAARSIKIWEFHEAPAEFKAMSEHGGDEDGVVFVPDGVEEPWWLSRLWNAYGEPDRYKTYDGQVIIWAHA